MKKFNEFIQEKANKVIETKNVAKPGDWIITAKTDTKEQYVLPGKKFPKLYDIDSALTPKDSEMKKEGFMEYKTIPETRSGMICTRGNLDALKELGEGLSESDAIPQERIMEIMQEFKGQLVKCSKKKSAYARQVKENEGEVEVITYVHKARKPEEMWIVPVWGGTMPICEDDVLIVNSEEVYRIARFEFDQTYNID